jgi:hypothetical protein
MPWTAGALCRFARGPHRRVERDTQQLHLVVGIITAPFQMNDLACGFRVS